MTLKASRKGKRVLVKSNAGRKPGVKTRAGGTMTEAQFRTFVTRALRKASVTWAPVNQCKVNARVRRGIYLCACCKSQIKPTIRVDGKTKNNLHIDHREPVVPVETGFTTWDDYVERLFCEATNLDLLCIPCHKEKTSEEAEQRAHYKRINKAK